MTRPSAADLLAGARFRTLCVAVATELDPEVASLVWDLRARVGEATALPGTFRTPSGQVDRLAQRLAGAPTEALAGWADPLRFLPAFVTAVDSAMPWQAPHVEDAVTADARVREALLPVAEAVLASPAAAWWGSDVDLDAQWVTTPVRDGRVVPNSSPGPIAETLARWSANHDRENAPPRGRASAWRSSSGSWWSAPHNHGPAVDEWASPHSSTRRVAGLGSVELELVEDGFGDHEAYLRRLSPTRPPRVHEVHTAADWADLVARWPRDATAAHRGDWFRSTGRDVPWSVPDWPRVAEELDAVHVSVQGWLAASGEAVDVPGGATVLAGWNPDETYWLTDDVTVADEAEHWSSDDAVDEILTWRRV
jgi:hypothetical protein